MEMESESELRLDSRKLIYSFLLKSSGDQTHEHYPRELEEFLSLLEDERNKINAFERELPICIQLLTSAVETSKQQLQAFEAARHLGTIPVLEEFIPLKTASEISDCNNNNNNVSTEDKKANWMETAQLWSHAGSKEPSGRSIPISKEGNGGTYHAPFTKEINDFCSVPHLSLSQTVFTGNILQDTKTILIDNSQQKEAANSRLSFTSKKENAGSTKTLEKGTSNNSFLLDTNLMNPAPAQPQRKARRCWSPELHRRFVNALQMLGGSQAATPKQIRELMKVNGLTNDEVKSHLQKYRLHTRRPSASPLVTAAASTTTPQLVVLGSLWVQTECAPGHAGHHAVDASLAHQPPRFCVTHVSPVLQFPAQQLHSHIYQCHDSSNHCYVVGAATREQSVNIEGDKSQSASWKGESVDTASVVRKEPLLGFRQDGDETSNSAAPINLTF